VADDRRAPASLANEATMFGGGIASTLIFAVLIAAFVGGWERGVRTRCVLGRMIVADAVVLTVFNFLPVPPLDGGRAALAAITVLRGTPLSDDALFWTQLSGLALAIIPMMLWTGWTRRLDAISMRWKAPRVK
jgi:Zn-dependent protease